MTQWPHLTVVGSINEDITIRTPKLLEPGETITAHAVSTGLGGKGANQAVAAARLAGSSSLIGAVGTDDAGGRLVHGLSVAEVDVSNVVRVSGSSGTAFVTVDDEGENAILVIPGANHALTVPEHLDGPVLCQLEIPLEAVVAAGEATAGFFAVNAAPAHRLPASLVDRADLIIVNESEYQALPEVRMARLLVVTLGSAGAVAYAEGKEIASCPAPRVSAVSTVGAGDAFCAALVLALANERSLETAMRAACAVGAAAVESDAAQPKLGPLDTYLDGAEQQDSDGRTQRNAAHTIVS
jgi:ribokinase